MQIDHTKSPRLYVPDTLSGVDDIDLSKDQAHYLVNVMRKNDGDMVRVFNGFDGEFIAKLSMPNKKTVTLKWIEKIKDQSVQDVVIHLYCSPIKKDRFAFMIEKAVELGVTHIHPIVTKRTQNAKINHDKCEKYIIEAAEQCERMDIPKLNKPILLDRCDFVAPSYAAIERQDDTPLFTPKKTNEISVVIGPEGGWDAQEIDILTNHQNIQSVNLGTNILRAETAAIFMLSRIVQ